MKANIYAPATAVVRPWRWHDPAVTPLGQIGGSGQGKSTPDPGAVRLGGTVTQSNLRKTVVPCGVTPSSGRSFKNA
jgi:hypothetical protein